MLYFTQGRNQGCCHGAQPGPSEWNYHWYCWDTGGHHPEGTARRMDSCPIISLTRRSGIRSQETLPVKGSCSSWLLCLRITNDLSLQSVLFLLRRKGSVSPAISSWGELGSKPNLLHEMVTDGGWTAPPGENRGLGIREGKRVYWRPPVCTYVHKHTQTHIHAYTHTTLKAFLVFSLPLFSTSLSADHFLDLWWPWGAPSSGVHHIPEGADWRHCEEWISEHPSPSPISDQHLCNNRA